MVKIKVDFTHETVDEKRELNRAKRGSIPLMIIYPANPERPGVYLDGTVSPSDSLKALKYAKKYS